MRGWVKGVSGNPGGRPIGVERAGREFADKLAGGEKCAAKRAVLQFYWDVWHDTENPIDMRLKAAKSFDEASHGKPSQHIDLSTEPESSDEDQAAEERIIMFEGIARMSTEELQRLAMMSPEDRLKLSDPAPSPTIQ